MAEFRETVLLRAFFGHSNLQEHQPLLGLGLKKMSKLENLEAGVTDSLAALVQQMAAMKALQVSLSAQIEAQHRNLQALNTTLLLLAETINQSQLPDAEPVLQALHHGVQRLSQEFSQTDSRPELKQLKREMIELQDSFWGLQQALKVQQDIVQSHFELRVMALQMIGTGLVSAVAVIVGLWLLFPGL